MQNIVGKTFQAIFGNILKVLKFVSHMEKYEKNAGIDFKNIGKTIAGKF